MQMPGSKTMKYVFVTIIFYKILFGFCGTLACQKETCRYLLQISFVSFLKKDPKHRNNFCDNLEEIVECLQDCPQRFLPAYIEHGFTSRSVHKLCDSHTIYNLNLHWNCIEKHLHQLLTCVSASGSVKAVEELSDPNRLECKRVMSILECPNEVLSSCDSDAIQVVNDAFIEFFQPYLIVSCHGITISYAVDLRIQHVLNKSFTKMAKCLDNLEEIDTDCFVLMGSGSNDLLFSCSDYGMNCIQASSLKCVIPNPLNDFYVPVFSFGQHSCYESPFETELTSTTDTAVTVTTPYISSSFISDNIVPPARESLDEFKSESNVHFPSEYAVKLTPADTTYSPTIRDDAVDFTTIESTLDSQEVTETLTFKKIHSTSRFKEFALNDVDESSVIYNLTEYSAAKSYILRTSYCLICLEIMSYLILHKVVF